MRFPITRLASALLPAMAAFASGAAQADTSGPNRPVGEITLSVGPVTKTSAQGIAERVTRGSRIAPGDRLDTADGGHVHIRFVDGALVSVRPGSRLWVEDYRYEPADVSKSLVRFKLEYGVARAISGAAAEGAKDRFRLNTPLVAIGVRGTDFVVRSGADGSSASVNQGAIVMAPFDDACKDAGLGPCRSASARLLAADMGRLLVEFQARNAQPEIRPVGGTTFIAGSTPENGQAGPRQAPLPAVSAASPRSDDVLQDTVAHGAVLSAIDVGVVTPPPPPPAPPPPPPSPTPAPPAPPPPAPAEPPALSWGRWADQPAGATDFSVTREEAQEGRKFIAGNTRYLLYRNDGGQTVLAPGLGSYSFSLDKAHAMFQKGSAISAATVQSGQLSIDFNRRQFDTQLQVASDPTGMVSIVGGGAVQRDGTFTDRSVSGQSISGAAGLDGKSAAYLFQKAISGGYLSGITLWSRP